MTSRRSAARIVQTSVIAAATVIAAASVGVVAGAPASGETTAARQAAIAARKPNIVLIVMDDMRKDDLPWLPTVRREIRRTGTRFANFYAPTPLCCPSRASLLRGQYAHNTGVLTNAEPDGGYAAFARLQGSTLATWLDPTYATGYVGKYLNGYRGRRQTFVPPGWDDWNGTVRTYNYLRIFTNDNGRVVNESGVNSPRLFARQSKQFIRENAPAAEPYFLQLSFVTPHGGEPRRDGDHGRMTAYVAPRDRGTYNGPRHSRGPGYNEADVSDKSGPVADLRRIPARKRAIVALRNRQRRESLAAANRGIARVLDALDASGERRNTVLIFTSDNGLTLGEHRVATGKRLPYEESSKMPLLISGPGVPRRNVWHGPAGIQDIAPTILDIAGANADIRLDGRSVLPARGRRDDWAGRAILLEQAALPSDPENDGAVRFAPRRSVADTEFRYRGIVTKRWKLVQWYPSDRRRRAWELYDLRSDPHEVANLRGDDGTRKRIRSLKRRLDDLWMCAGRQCRR